MIGMTTAIVSMNARGQPLRLQRGDVEIHHEVGDRDAHRRLVEDRDERGRQQQPDDAVLLAVSRPLAGTRMLSVPGFVSVAAIGRLLVVVAPTRAERGAGISG